MPVVCSHAGTYWLKSAAPTKARCSKLLDVHQPTCHMYAGRQQAKLTQQESGGVPLAAGAELVAAIVLLLFGEGAHHMLSGPGLACICSSRPPARLRTRHVCGQLPPCFLAEHSSTVLWPQAACSCRAASSPSAPSTPPGATAQPLQSRCRCATMLSSVDNATHRHLKWHSETIALLSRIPGGCKRTTSGQTLCASITGGRCCRVCCQTATPQRRCQRHEIVARSAS